MEERMVTYGTRDRFGEFHSLREKLISETKNMDTAIESRSLIPKVMFSKKRKRIAKLEKRQRRTNKDTEEFLKNVSLIKKNIERLKVKVEEIKKKQGIVFAAPFISDEEFAELEKSGDAIYSDCYTIQAQIRSLESNPGSRYGSSRKMQYMQKEYLLSQLTSVMNEFRLMQTGYVDKRKQQFKENWVLSTEKTPHGTKPVETSIVEEESTSEQEMPKLRPKFPWKRNKSKSKSRGEGSTDTDCENDFKNKEKSTDIAGEYNSHIVESVKNTVAISCGEVTETLKDLNSNAEKVEISLKGEKSTFFTNFLLKRRTSKSKSEDEELIGKHTAIEGDIKNKLKTDIAKEDNSPVDELITNSVNMSKVSDTENLKSPNLITEKVESASNGEKSKILANLPLKRRKSKSKPGNEEFPSTQTSDFKNEGKTNNIAKGDKSTIVELTTPTVTVLNVADTKWLKVSSISTEMEESSSKKEKSQFFSNFSLKRRASKSKSEEREMTGPLTGVESDFINGEKTNKSTNGAKSIIFQSTAPTVTLAKVADSENLDISRAKEESSKIEKFQFFSNVSLKQRTSKTKSENKELTGPVTGVDSHFINGEISNNSANGDKSIIVQSTTATVLNVADTESLKVSNISTRNDNNISKGEKSKAFKKFLFKRSKSQSMSNGEGTVKFGGEHELQTPSIEDEDVFDGDHSQAEILSSSNNKLAKESGLWLLKEAAVITVNKNDSISKGEKSNFFSKFQLKRKKSQSKSEGEETPSTTTEDAFQIEETESIDVVEEVTVQKVEMPRSTEKSENEFVHTSLIDPLIGDENKLEGIKPKTFRFSFRGKKNKRKVLVEEEEPLNTSHKEGLQIDEAVKNYLQEKKVVADTKVSRTEDPSTCNVNLRSEQLKTSVVDDKVTKSESFSKEDRMKLFARFSFRRSKSQSDSKTKIPVEEVELQCKRTVVSQELYKGHNFQIEMDNIEEKSLGLIDSNQIQGKDQLEIERKTEKSKLELEAIKKREERLKHLEQNILEMDGLHKEMYSIVNSGGDQMNNIEYYVDTAKYNVEEGHEQLVKAEGLEKKYLKRKIICGVVVIILILIVVVVVLSIAL